GDRAVHWLDESSRLAALVPDDPARAWESFSAANVSIWRVAVGVERGESGGGVLELARDVNLDLFEPRSARRAGLMLDVGRGLAREPRMRADAVGWLQQAENAAPQLVRNNAAARETVAYLLNRANAAAGGRELRGMAARMGVPH